MPWWSQKEQDDEKKMGEKKQLKTIFDTFDSMVLFGYKMCYLLWKHLYCWSITAMLFLYYYNIFLEKKNLNHLKYIFIQFQSRWFYPLEAHQQIPPHRKGLVRSSNDDTREHNTSMKKKKKKTGNKGKVHCLLHCQVIHYYTCTCPLPVAPRH